MNSGWFAAIFWVGFLASIAAGEKYRWVDTMWLAALFIFMIAMSAYRLFYFRQHPDEQVTTARPIPRWMAGRIKNEK